MLKSIFVNNRKGNMAVGRSLLSYYWQSYFFTCEEANVKGCFLIQQVKH